MKETDENDIDYLHPYGKPQVESEPRSGSRKFDERELEDSARRKKNALIDADGHHICSADCQKAHKLKT